jgi:hypothetical protein
MSFSAMDGYAICADLGVGSNSNDWGTPSLMVGSSPNDASAQQYQWDTDPSDGFDSGWVQVDLSVSSDGTTALSINDGERQVIYQGAPTGEIQWFALRAGLSGSDDTVSFRNIQFKFYDGPTDGVAAEIDTVDDISATTVGTSAAAGTTDTDTEAIVEVGPEGSGYQKAVFSAQVRLQSAQQWPDPTELFGQVFVYASPTA